MVPISQAFSDHALKASPTSLLFLQSCFNLQHALRTTAFCDACFPDSILLLTSTHMPRVQTLSSSYSRELGRLVEQKTLLGRCARGLKTLHLLPQSPSSTHSMLGKQELSGIPSAPPKLFCLSGLATNPEYICAEGYSRVGTRGSHLLRQTVPVPVRKHPVQVDLAVAHRFPEQLN